MTMKEDVIDITAKNVSPGFPCPQHECTGRFYPYEPLVEYGKTTLGKCTICGEFRVRFV